MAGWLGLYVEQTDVPLLLERLNEDPEMPSSCRGSRSLEGALWRTDDLLGKTMLWHVPGGPLPLLSPSGHDSVIEDPTPRGGRNSILAGLDRALLRSWDGPAPCCWNSTREVERAFAADIIPLSGLSWHGRTSLKTPPPSTRRWWSRFRGWIRRQATRVTRSGPVDGAHPDIWAMPGALQAIQTGMERDDWPSSYSPNLGRAGRELSRHARRFGCGLQAAGAAVSGGLRPTRCLRAFVSTCFR